jgi:hypothetical protein
VRRTFRHYRSAAAITTYREFQGRTHWIIAEPGWEEVAAFVDAWLAEHRRDDHRTGPASSDH